MSSLTAYETELLQKYIQSVREYIPSARLETTGLTYYISDSSGRYLSRNKATHLKAWRDALEFLTAGGL